MRISDWSSDVCSSDLLPTLAEQGYPAFDLTAWFSFVAPPGTPAEVLATLQQALATTLQDPQVRNKMLTMGIEPRSGSAQELTQQIRTEQPIIEKLVNHAGLQRQYARTSSNHMP